MHLQKLHRFCRLEYKFASCFVPTAVLESIYEASFYFRLNSEVHRKFKISKLLSVQSVHGVVHLILLLFLEYELFIVKRAVLKLLSQVFMKELKQKT